MDELAALERDVKAAQKAADVAGDYLADREKRASEASARKAEAAAGHREAVRVRDGGARATYSIAEFSYMQEEAEARTLCEAAQQASDKAHRRVSELRGQIGELRRKRETSRNIHPPLSDAASAQGQ